MKANKKRNENKLEMTRFIQTQIFPQWCKKNGGQNIGFLFIVNELQILLQLLSNMQCGQQNGRLIRKMRNPRFTQIQNKNNRNNF